MTSSQNRQDRRSALDAKLDRIAAERDAAPANARVLADVIGSFVQEGRDAWIFDGSRPLGHVACADLDVADGVAILGDLRIPLDAAVAGTDDDLDVAVGDRAIRLNAAEDDGEGYAALDALRALLDDAAYAIARVHAPGGTEIAELPTSAITTGATPATDGMPGLSIPALDVAIRFDAIGARGLAPLGRGVVVLGLDGTTVGIEPVRG